MSQDITDLSWEELEHNLFQLLYTSPLESQRKTLDHLHNVIVDNTTDHHRQNTILLTLLKSYNQYTDKSLKLKVIALIDLVVAKDVSLNVSNILKYIKTVVNVTKPNQSIAANDLNVLLSWINHLQTQYIGSDLKSEILNELIVYQFEISSQLAFYYTAVRQTSRTRTSKYHLQELFLENYTVVKNIIAKDAKQLQSYHKVLSSLSLSAYIDLASVLAKLDSIENPADIINYYLNNVLLNKNTKVIVDQLSWLSYFNKNFLFKYLIDDILSSKFLTELEKSLLRSNEFIVNHILVDLLDNLNITYSLLIAKDSNFTKLFTSLLSNLKSSTESIRLNSLKSLKTILTKVNDTLDNSVSIKIIEESFKSLKSTSNADYKLGYIKLLSFVNFQANSPVSDKLLDDLSAFVTKDQNEVLLDGFLNSFFKAFFQSLLLSQDDFKKYESLVKIINNGLNDKKQQLRKYWFSSLGTYLIPYFSNESTNITHLEKFLDDVFASFVTNFKDLIANPLKVSTVIGYVITTIASKVLSTSSTAVAHKFKVENFTTKLIENPNFILTNSKFFLKLATDSEKQWFINALFASINDPILIAEEEVSLQFGRSLIYAALTKHFHFSLNQDTFIKLNNFSFVNQKLAGELITKSLYQILLNIDTEDVTKLDLNFKYTRQLLYSITSGLSLNRENYQKPKDSDALAKTLVDLLVISHYRDFANIKNGWVGLVQKSNLNPGDLVQNYGIEFFNDATEKLLQITDVKSDLYDAIVKSIAKVAFIQPDLIGVAIDELIKKDLDLQKLNSINELAVAVWRAPEGELVNDPLENSSKSKYAENKNTKDYETRKWEESIKKEIEAKKGKSTKKLSKEEHELVNKQLAKESDIRKNIQSIYLLFNRSVRIISALATDLKVKLDNGYKYWLADAINLLLTVIHQDNSSDLLGHSAIETFLNASNILVYENPSLDLVKVAVGVAVLRLFDVRGIPQNFLQENLTDLISRVLFKIKFLSDNKPLDTFGLIYILPLLIEILHKNAEILLKSSANIVNTVKAEFVEEDQDEEQLLLAIDIVSNHAEIFEDDKIPREPILRALIKLMEIPSKSKVSKDCFNSLCQNISNNVSNKDLGDLLSNLLSPNKSVRSAILEQVDEEFILDDLAPVDYIELWISCFDNDASNAELAVSIWEENKLELTNDMIFNLLNYLGNEDTGLRISVAKSIGQSVKIKGEQEKDLFNDIFHKLIDLLDEKSKPPPPIYDEYGLIVKTSEQQKDKWEVRSGIALAFKELAPLFNADAILTFFQKLINDEKFLGDSNPEVQQELQDAGVEVITLHGLSLVQELIPVFEQCLSERDLKNKKQDKIKQSTVILYGALARHLSSNDAKLIKIVDQLVKALDSPSEDVQYTVSEYIAPLVKLFESKLSEYFDQLFVKLFNGKTMSQRRGAAYGISGLVKGAGIRALADYDIIRNLSEAAEDKRDPKKREAASVAFECLSKSLESLFEPYVIEIIPLILKSLGDQVPEVRASTDLAAQVIMKHTTPFGVKKLIPLAIENLDEIAWRSKKGSVELLGSMAYLDPTQLSASLSTIVPEIVGVLNDTHKEVRKAADQALKRFGEVIRNPEIQKSVPILIKAIGDPTKYTEEALDALIKTQFVHYIDGPSLALIIHVIHRGMLDRSANTKRKSCQIVGNMSILVDSKDLVPYLHNLVSELEIAMVDPVPTTRATAARALGSLVEKLGEEHFPGLIDKLLSTLSDDAKEGDRLGSAQALAEVLSGLGVSKLEETMPTILAGASHKRAYVRAGYMPLLLYLPVCFSNQFAPYISRILPPILSGLADEDDTVNDIAIRAGKLVVSNYANKAVDLFLPELENGLSNVNYRIRLSSVKLTGDLLFQLAGISQKSIDVNGELTEHDEQLETVYLTENTAANAKLVEVLGQERRDRVLSLLFICRSDIAGTVRNAAIEIWNPLVSNTPRTVKEILPTLATIIIRRLASSDESQRRISATALGDLVRRIGPSVLSQLLPTSEEIMISGDADAKQGICIALREIMASTMESNIIEHQDVFIKIVSDAIIDSNENVREAAGQAFDGLLEAIGKPAIDGIIPHLLRLLDSETESENAIKALREIMFNKSDEIFPILIPSLLSPPIDASKASALGALAEVAGQILYRHLSNIINSILDCLVGFSSAEDTTRKQVSKAFTKVLLSVTDDEGCHPLMQQILALLKNENKKKVLVMFEHLSVFFSQTTLDYSIYTADVVQRCIGALDDDDDQLVKYDWEALNELVKHQSKESLEKLVGPAQHTLKTTGTSGKDLKAFKIVPKGPNCVLPIFIHGLMYGSSIQKETSAVAIADIVSKTPALNLKPFFTTITGPLIRVIGERVSGDVKAAILSALNMLLEKIPQFLRPFIPQLQRTFIKSLSDTGTELLRLRAAKALGTLIQYQPRIDPLVSELINGVKGSEDSGVKTAMLKALIEVTSKVGFKLNEASKHGVIELIEQEIFNVDDKLIVAYAKLIGSVSRIMSQEEAIRIIKEKILSSENTDSVQGESGKFAVLTLNAFLKDSPKVIFESGLSVELVKFLINGINSPEPYLSDQSILAAGKILLLCGETSAPKQYSLPDLQLKKGASDSAEIQPFELADDLVNGLVVELSNVATKPVSNSIDSRRLALVVIRTVARLKFEEVVKPNINTVATSVFSCVRDVIIPIKLAAEKSYLEVFRLVQDEELTFFNEWFKDVSENLSTDKKTIKNSVGAVIQLRSIGDYTKRVAVRLANVERERLEAGGDEEAMFSDRFEDEKEIWSVGGVELTKV